MANSSVQIFNVFLIFDLYGKVLVTQRSTQKESVLISKLRRIYIFLFYKNFGTRFAAQKIGELFRASD